MFDVMLHTAEISRGLEVKDWLPVGSTVVALAAVIASYVTSKAVAWQKANETELKDIQDRLDSFYGRFHALSDVNKLMNRDLRDRQADKGSFILIEKLFDEKWRASLKPGEIALLAEIAENSKSLRTIIEENAGRVDEQIAPYLSRLAAHYRMIELAYDRKLGEDATPFVARYVFPKMVEAVLQLEVDRLKRRAEVLRTKPFAAAGPIERLSIPQDLRLPDWPNPPREERSELTMPVSQ